MTYRTIDVAHEKRLSKPSQPAPVLQWLAVTDLVIDDTYQRGLTPHSWNCIRKIAGGFDWSHFGALLVAPVEGGRFAIIDGQHRAHAAAICGIEAVPAILSLLPVSAQARAFAVVNSSAVKVSPLQVYKAALASGEGWALQCRAAVEAAGCDLRTSNGNNENKRVGDVFSVVLIKDLVGRGASEAVTKGLAALVSHAEHIGDVAGRLLFRDDVLRPWLTVLEANPGYLALDLADFLKRNRLLNLLETAGRLRLTPEYGTTPAAVLKRNAVAARLAAFARGQE